MTYEDSASWPSSGQSNKVEGTYYHADGRINEAYKYSDYEVDSEGNWVKRQSWQSKGGKAEFVPYQVERRTITYHGKGTPIQSASGGLPKLVRLSTGVLQGRATKRVAPAYPPGTAAMVAGEALVEVTVDEQGNVISAKGVSGDKALADL